MLQQVFLDSKYADFSYDTGQQVHWLADPLEKPEGFFFKVHVLTAWIPLTYYNVTQSNNRFDLAYSPTDTQSIEFPVGNRDIDELVEILNEELRHAFEASYDPSTNKMTLSQGSSAISIESSSTCLGLLGFEPGVHIGAVTARYGVDLTRTTSILLRSNLHGTNRDPFTKRMSDILCKVPVSHQQPNEIIEYKQPAFVRITNPSLTHFTLGLYDDDNQPLDLNGNRWTVTLQISVERDETHMNIPRYLVNEPVDDSPREPKGKQENKA